MPTRPDGRRLLPALPFTAALGVYLFTMAPGLFWGDSAQLQRAVVHPRWGIGPRDYPLWTAGARALRGLTGLDPARSANLFTGIMGALAVALAFVLAARETRSALAGLAAASALAVSHLLWSSSTAAEVYTLAAVLLLLMLLAAGPAAAGNVRCTFLFGLLAGISLLHHRMLLLAAFAATLALAVRWIGRARPLRHAAVLLSGMLAGAVPFLALWLVSGPAASSPTGFFLGDLCPEDPLGARLSGLLSYEARFVLWNLAGPQLAFAAVGLLLLLRRERFRPNHLLLVALASLACPLFFPRTGDRYVFLVPALCASTVWIAKGFEAARARLPQNAAISLLVLVAVCPPALYAVAARTLLPRRLGLFKRADTPHVRGFLWPGKRTSGSVRRFGETVLEALPEGAVLFSHWGDGQVLRYLRDVEGVRPDVRILDATRIREAAPVPRGRNRVFLSTYPFLPLPERGALGKRLIPVIEGALYEVRERE